MSTKCEHNHVRIRVYSETALTYDYYADSDKLEGPEIGCSDRHLSNTVIYCLDCGWESDPDYPDELKKIGGGQFKKAIEAFEAAPE